MSEEKKENNKEVNENKIENNKEVSEIENIKEGNKIDREDVKYRLIKKNLGDLADNNYKKILSICIPGTGGSSKDMIPTIEPFYMLKSSDYKIPLYVLEGAGSGEKAPIFRNPKYLEFQKKQKSSIFKSIYNMFYIGSKSEEGASINSTNEVFASTESGADLAGTITGVGEKQNNETVLNLLATLEDDGLLPEEIVLTGHSRGAINSIYLANEIYKKYGDKIKIHLILTDPVPGPGHSSFTSKQIVPPNVVTFTAFYAQDHENKLFAPHDLSVLKFTSPDTVITSYSTFDDHGSILSNNKVKQACLDVVSGIYGVKNFSSNDSRFKELVKNLNEDKKIYNEFKNIKDEDLKSECLKYVEKKYDIEKKEDIEEFTNYILRKVSNYGPHDTKEMNSKEENSSRKNCIYVAKTDIDIKDNNKYLLNDQLRFNLHKLRDDFDKNPDELIQPKNTGKYTEFFKNFDEKINENIDENKNINEKINENIDENKNINEKNDESGGTAFKKN